jgi:hypothetical protein
VRAGGSSLALLIALAAFAMPASSAQGKFGLSGAEVVQRPALSPGGDWDRDGLKNGAELRRTRTSPHKFDTDGDGFGDGAEAAAGSNPRDPASVPVPKGPAGSPPSGPQPGIGPALPIDPGGPPPGDTAPPNTKITSGPSGATSATGASFGFESTERGSSFQCRLDAGAWGACSSPQAYGSLGLGAHSFAARAIDASGNADPSPATRGWTVAATEVPITCTTTLAAGADVAAAVEAAAGGAVICLAEGDYPQLSLEGVHKSPPVTVRSGPGGRATVDGITLTDPRGLQFAALDITDGTTVTPSGSGIRFVDNDITGVAGIYLFGDYRIGQRIEDVVIEGNTIHDLDYQGHQDTGYGYGIEGVGEVENMTIRGNTIQSPASDYIQSATPVDWVVDRNTFLGPSLLGSHEDHQDLWQIFGGGENITFTNNVARDTETQESLLFQEGAFSDVVVENNLFDHDSLGYSCQIYQSSGLVFRRNTIVGSHWGCLFRDLATGVPGSEYEVDHNVFTGTEASVDVSTEGRADAWGAYDYNVSGDGSADGAHSVRNWKPSWLDVTGYVPLGLPFTAGFRP